MHWLRLIRWKNLIIIFLTQLVAWGCVVLPEDPLVLQPFAFLLIALSTALIAAAGYIINDYFDVSIDAINKPDRVVLETLIPRKHAIIAHSALNVVALILAGLVAARAHHYEWLLVQLSCTLLLWFYSTWFKRQYVSGNVVVALLSAATVLVLLVYEPVILHRHRFGRPSGASLAVPALVLLCYAFFAFMLTWMREIVKDMEDLRGDEANGCKTMPILKGLQYSRNFALALGVLVMISLGSIAAALLSTQAELLMAYLVVIAMAIGYWGAFMLRRNTSSGHYRTASRGLKAIMLLGIFSLVLYYFQSAVYNDL